ncbi:DegV family protein [Cellulomonas persica]|uniref:DegV domain-containing protein n=1 Tax=Cellulomonas persica TaxID=76861 RepID=A0A510UYF4_9CELL|nr:DegV family protein [Cellulomonas persica]GEK17845.1 DegV domain-containing protein [Cellulomonas persica]
MTDSTASLPADVAQRWGVGVVPLDVLVGTERHVEGVDLTPADLLVALRRGTRVSTSQPPPAAFAAAYRAAAEAGAREIVSVHLSGELSGTVSAARVAAAGAPVPVHVMDSTVTVMALGYTVLAAARYARGLETSAGTLLDGPPELPPAEPARAPERLGAWVTRALGRAPEPTATPDGAAVARLARERSAQACAWFLVDSLDHLRRGGRLSAPAAALGTVLGLRPLLTLQDGHVVVAEKVRTRRAARERLEALARAHADSRGQVRVAVHHLDQAELAAELVAQVEQWPGVLEVVACETSAAIAAHVGPGLLALVVVDA